MDCSTSGARYEPFRRDKYSNPDDETMPQQTLSNGNASSNVDGQTQVAAQPQRDEMFLTSSEPSITPVFLATGSQSLSGISIRGYFLGVTSGMCTAAALQLWWFESTLWRLPFFFVLLSIFHFLEFYTTARFNSTRATLDSFLLTSNGTAYNIAHTVAAFETTLSHSLWPYPRLISQDWNGAILATGFVLIGIGQLARSIAMVEAGTNFDHTVQRQRKTGHVLVTTGIYGILRHPSYFGFFWWSLGSQLVLGNVICFAAYAAILWTFFSRRIKGEEKLLVQFFGDAYVGYRKRTHVGIPFIS